MEYLLKNSRHKIDIMKKSNLQKPDKNEINLIKGRALNPNTQRKSDSTKIPTKKVYSYYVS